MKLSTSKKYQPIAPELSSRDNASCYRPDIDGLRAIAVASVVIYHAHIGAFASGFVGVDIFFVISGYLIAGIIFREVTTNQFTFLGFYARRARRILPALIVVLLASMAAGFLFLGPTELASNLSPSAASALLGFSNIYFLQVMNYFAANANLQPLLMTWSLGVEEQFYVLFPAFLIILYRFCPKHIFLVIFALTAGSLILAIWKTADDPEAAFYLANFRGWELGCGALLAIGQSKNLRGFRVHGAMAEGLGLLGLALLVEAIFFLDGPFPGWRALLPAGGTAALILSQPSFINRKLLSFKPFAGIGLVSYSWYLWHWPLMSFTRIVSVRPPPNDVMAGVVVVSLIAGILSWRFIERPFRKARALPAATLRQYGLAVVAVLVALECVALAHGFPNRVSGTARSVDDQINAGFGQGGCLVGDTTSAPNLSTLCDFPGPAGKIALIGDSHAHALGPGLRLIAEEHGYGVAEMTKSSCPALAGVTRRMPDNPHHAALCGTFNKLALAAILRDPKIKMVIIEGFWASTSYRGAFVSKTAGGDATGTALLERGLAAYVQALMQAGKRVIVMGDVPLFSFDAAQEALTQSLPPRLLAHRLIWGDDGMSRGQAPWRLIKAPRDGSDIAVRKVAASIKGVLYYDPAAYFCAAQGCLFSDGAGVIYYADTQHLSPAGSIRAEKALAELIFSGSKTAGATAAAIPEIKVVTH